MKAGREAIATTAPFRFTLTHSLTHTVSQRGKNSKNGSNVKRSNRAYSAEIRTEAVAEEWLHTTTAL